MIACSWRKNAAAPVSSAMDANQLFQRRVALPVAMHEYRKLQLRHLGEAAGLCQFDDAAAVLRSAPASPARAAVSSSASLTTRCGACRVISRAM